MDARRISAAFLAVALLSSAELYGAVAQSRNFVVTTPNPHFAQQAAQLAEKYRRDLALQWLGHELPPWKQPCPVTIHVGPKLGAGGATSFCFHNGQPFDWRMTIQGPADRLLDSVLPHEVLHTVFATHFGCPLPRWADEGACTTIEHPTEKAKYHQSLIEALTTGRGIPFNRMFAMKQYPSDVLPLYAQGHSLARYLISLGGKQQYVAYVGDGMKGNNWTAATTKHYGFKSLSDLQVTWNNWVAQGCPSVEPISPEDNRELLAGARGGAPAGVGGMNVAADSAADDRVALADVNESKASGGVFPASVERDGWYDRNRRAMSVSPQPSATADNSPVRSAAGAATSPIEIGSPPSDQTMSRPQQPPAPQQIFLEGGYQQPRPLPAQLPAYGQPLRAVSLPSARPLAPVAVPPRPAPVRQVIPAGPSPGTYYPTSNALPLTISPSYMGGSCFGGT